MINDYKKDWAVDLQSFADEGAKGDDENDEDYLADGDMGWNNCTAIYVSLDAMWSDDGIP